RARGGRRARPARACAPRRPRGRGTAKPARGEGWVVGWGGGGPRRTPAEIVATLNREINAGLASEKIRARFAELGTAPMVQTPDEFWAFSRAGTDKWQKVIETAGIKVD